jgi:hypothetical protein
MTDMPKLFSVKTLPAVTQDPEMDTSTYESRFVEFHRMRGQSYNPAPRIDHNRTKYKELKRSIAEHGIVQPPVLTSDLVRLDGHRRCEAGTDLGMLGTVCKIAPFDSSDSRAPLLYKLLNTIEVMPGRQKMAVLGKGGPELAPGMGAQWKAITKSLGTEGYYIGLFGARGYVPQLWSNCKAVAELVFNNSIEKDRGAREPMVHRAVMKWQCHDEGLGRQAALKRYCTKVRNGASGYTAKALWKAIQTDQDIAD